MDRAKIKNWSVIDRYGADVFKAPQHKVIHIKGEIFDHPKHEDGTSFTTSRVIKTEGRWIMTASDKTYELDGDASFDYVDWCESNDHEISAEWPVEVISSTEFDNLQT